MRYPDIYLVGAPKCATTALYSYLQPHPQLFLPDFKEPHYFAMDLNVRRHRTTLDRYLKLYASARPAQLTCDGSVWYLYSQRAAEEIHAVAPEARIIIMLRSPLQMIPSLHSHQVFNGIEDLPLDEALAAEDDRAAGRNIPSNAHFVEGLLYRRAATFSQQVERYLDAFGRDRTRVILYDDLVADVSGTYRATLEFLGVDPGFHSSFSVVNRHKVARSRRASRFLTAPPSWFRAVGRAVVPARLRSRVYGQMVSLNARSEQRTKLTPELRAQLASQFEPEIAKLEQLIGRDLSGWT